MPLSNGPAVKAHGTRRGGACWCILAVALVCAGAAPAGRAAANGVPDPPPTEPCEAKNWKRKDIKEAGAGYKELLDAKFKRHVEEQQKLLATLERTQGRNCTSCRAIRKELDRVEERKEARAKDCQRLLRDLKKNWSTFSECSDRDANGDMIVGGVSEGVMWKIVECESPEKVCEYVHDMVERLVYRAETQTQAATWVPDCLQVLYPDADSLDPLLYDKGGWLP